MRNLQSTLYACLRILHPCIHLFVRIPLPSFPSGLHVSLIGPIRVSGPYSAPKDRPLPALYRIETLPLTSSPLPNPCSPIHSVLPSLPAASPYLPPTFPQPLLRPTPCRPTPCVLACPRLESKPIQVSIVKRGTRWANFLLKVRTRLADILWLCCLSIANTLTEGGKEGGMEGWRDGESGVEAEG